MKDKWNYPIRNNLCYTSSDRLFAFRIVWYVRRLENIFPQNLVLDQQNLGEKKDKCNYPVRNSHFNLINTEKVGIR
jgi:hypothetical protein